MLPKVVMVFVWEELPNHETTEVVTKKKSFKWQIWKQIGYYFRMYTL